MNLMRKGMREGRPSQAAPPSISRDQAKRSSNWFRRGMVAGLLLWTAALPLLGDPRISSVVPPVGEQTLPVLVARSSFEIMAETPTPGAPQMPTPNTKSGTQAQPRVMQPVMAALAMPDVRELLGTAPAQSAGMAQVLGGVAPVPATSPAPGITRQTATEPPTVTSPTVATPQAAQSPTISKPLQPAPAVPATPPEFSYPERLAPGVPSATMAQVVNPTRNAIKADIRPTFAQDQDARLCSALRGAIVAIESGKAPRMMTGGGLQEMARGTGATMELEPGERYNLAILVSVPWDLPNEFQGVGCTVNFVMYSQGAQP